jgi:Domain of unknown function (DUF4157)
MFASRAAQKHTQDRTPSRAKQTSQAQTPGLGQPEHVPEASPSLQRYLGNGYVQAMTAMGGEALQAPAVSPVVHVDAVPAGVEQALASPGRPLEPALRQEMEQRFGYDFSRVRVHADPRAVESTQALQARAYTVGQHIVMGEDQPSSETIPGRQLLAHELAHVVQQSRGAMGRPGLAHEEDADRAARAVQSGEPASVTTWSTCGVPQGAPPESSKAERPPQTVKVKTSAGEVYAPYRVEDVNDVPRTHDGMRMEVRNQRLAVWIANPTLTVEQVEALPDDKLPREITLGQLRNYSRAKGLKINVLIASYGGRENLVGYDSFRVGELQPSEWASFKDTVREGYVEGAPRSRGVGRSLIVRRIVTAIQSNAQSIYIQVGSPDATVQFNTELVRAAKIKVNVEPGKAFWLDTTAMANVLAEWGEDILTPAQREALRQLAKPYYGRFNERLPFGELQKAIGKAGSPKPTGGTSSGGGTSTVPQRGTVPPSGGGSVPPVTGSAEKGGQPPKTLATTGPKPATAAPPVAPPQPQVPPNVAKTPAAASSGPAPSRAPIESRGAPVEPIRNPASFSTKSALEGGALALLSRQFANLQAAEGAKAAARLKELLPEVEGLHARGYGVEITVVAEVPNKPDLAARMAGIGDPGQITYFKKMYISQIMPAKSARITSNEQPAISPNLAPGDPDQDDPHERKQIEQIKGQMGVEYPVQGTGPRPGYRLETRQLRLPAPETEARRATSALYVPHEVKMMGSGETEKVQRYGLSRLLRLPHDFGSGRLGSADLWSVEMWDLSEHMRPMLYRPLKLTGSNDYGGRFRGTFEKADEDGAGAYVIYSSMSLERFGASSVVIEEAAGEDLRPQWRIGSKWKARIAWRKIGQ